MQKEAGCSLGSLQKFCLELPKIELHAHLNGSLSVDTLLALQKLKISENADNLKNASLDQFTIKDGDSRTLSDCFEVFRIAHALVDSPSAVRLATTCTIKDFYSDGCIYLELRSTPKVTQNMTKEQYIKSMIDGIKDAEDSFGEPAITTRLIISIDRRMSYEQAMGTYIAAVNMFTKNPDYVCGIELSGDPNEGNFSLFKPILEGAKNRGLKVTLHMAEVSNPNEVFDMIEFHPDRVGHTTCVHPSKGGTQSLWEKFLQSKIPAELCLTSNIKCRSISDYHQHHFKYLWEAGHPISLATDDKGVFSTSLSEEYKICAETFNLNHSQLMNLAESAIDQIFADETVKKRLRDTFVSFRILHENIELNGM